MTRLAGFLIGKSISLHLILPLLIAFDGQFNKPPLGAEEIKAIVMSIANRELAKRRVR
jgi:hypothetical protein